MAHTIGPTRTEALQTTPAPSGLDHPSSPPAAAASPPASAKALEQLVAACAQGLADRLGKDVQVKATKLVQQSSQQLRRASGEPSACFDSLVLSPQAPPIQLEFSTPLALGVIDVLLGGAGNETPTHGRALTGVQRRLLAMAARSVEQAVAELLKGLPPEPAEPLAVLWAQVQVQQARGSMRLAMPAALMAGLERRLAQSAAGVVEVSVQLAEVPISPAQLAGLAVGDVLDTELPVDSPVEVLVDGQVRLIGKLGRLDAKPAVRITGPAGTP